jgi:hypothetical protein
LENTYSSVWKGGGREERRERTEINVKGEKREKPERK